MNMSVTTRLLVYLVFVHAMAGCGASTVDGPIVIDPPPPPPGPTPMFVARGLVGATVVDLIQADDRIFAGTDSGIYRHERDDQWVRTTLDTWSVLSLESIDGIRLIASVETGRDTHQLVESLDRGESWSVLTHNFGGAANGLPREPVQRLRFDPASGELLATGYGVLARSDDLGRSWEILDGGWSYVGTGLGALSIAAGQQQIWYGGQGAIEEPILLRYQRSSGQSEDLSDSVEALLPRPSTVEAVRFYPNSESTVFVTGEGGVIRSSDSGTSWEPVLVNSTSRFYFDLIIDDHTGTVYTASWNKDFSNPQPLILEVSTDSGITWTAYEHANANLRGGVWSMQVVTLDGQRRLFLGLQGGGVYEVNLRVL